MKIEKMTPEQFAEHLRALRMDRKTKVHEGKASSPGRARLNSAQRQLVLTKTGGRCHVCGGKIDGEWQADHVLAHSAGGKHAPENYLPAHSVCNNYRWHYSAEEFQVILKLGVMARTMVERGQSPGPEIATAFVRHERRRIERTRAGKVSQF